MILRVFPFNVSIRSRVIDYYKMLRPRLSTEEKLTKIQRHLREFYAIKVNKKTIEFWIKDYEQKLKKIQKEINLKTKEEESYIKFDITGLRYRDPFEAEATGWP